MFAEHFLQTFSVAPFVSADARGDETYAPVQTYACRYQPSTRLVRDRDGVQVVSEAVLYTLQAVDIRDTIYPPGADTNDINQGRKPIRVDTHYDLHTGQLSHYAVTI